MVQTLQDIKGGGGSIKLGTTGTISALMCRELERTESALKVAPSLSSFASSVDEASRTLKPGTSSDEASSSGVKTHKSPQNPRRKHYTPRIPMLKSGDITTDESPTKKKPVKKVEIVNIKCRIHNKIWMKPITHRIKKLGFSKLSDSVP